MVSEGMETVHAKGMDQKSKAGGIGGERSSPASFTSTLGSFPRTPSTETTSPKPANVLRLDDEDDEILPDSHGSFAPQPSAARPPLPRQQSLNRRGQSFPAVSITPSHVRDALGVRDSPASPEFRDTFTPDIQSNAWPLNQSPPRRLGASSQLQGSSIGTKKTATERWKWIQNGIRLEDGNGSSSPDGNGSNSPDPVDHGGEIQSPTLQAMLRRQRELRGSTQIDSAIKQALYDHWTPVRKGTTNEQILDLEVFFKEKFQQFIANTKSLITGPEENYSPPVKSGWVECQRKGLWSSKTVRQHVQLCMDGSFMMRKTEQPTSPVICIYHVNDIDVEADPDCELTIRLVPHGSRHLQSATRGPQFRLTRGPSFRSRVVPFKVNDPVSRNAWIQAFSMRKRIARESAQDKISVQSLVSQLKLGDCDIAHSAVGRGMSGLLSDHRRKSLAGRVAAVGGSSTAASTNTAVNLSAIPSILGPLPRTVPEGGSDYGSGQSDMQA